MTDEVGLDFDREWVEFFDPDDPDTMVRADLTWLLSRWGCIFTGGSGDGDRSGRPSCPGIDLERPADGCCLHGAFYTDADDIKRVRKIVKKLTPETWQLHRPWGETIVDDTLENEDGEEEPAKKTAVVDGACVFHNREGFGAGAGCVLHQQAMRDGVHPMAYKPEVCWQLPVKRDFRTDHRADGREVSVTLITEFDRPSWGPGGHDFDWWCTGSPLAHTAAEPVYRSYATELVELLGRAAYERLAELCERREKLGQVAPHPATARAAERLAMPTRWR
ncbi:hypothetical protein K3N28_06795 [Glycomyces sp. TRM65418]|uniref:hypothetical protein n=1 Tax=Glycomyces sp. TRM65418 TaxID=2867006 RepID=UPI001CE5131A|nr:hypothetical protein [Glycomyces sp. TRM65418]MCC3762778.1 hypothetical protein [Glycomyces sp. TRM65418]QZD56808.1 hypothetical protein K3N28_06745 [Glycomyces sp. TRM65418]